jgi:hypothetical protein
VVCYLQRAGVMSFESMHQAMGTLAGYSRDVVDLYRRKQVQSPCHAVRACLQLAIKYELRMQVGIVEASDQLSAKQQSAHFKWHDRWQLVNVSRLSDRVINDVDDVLSLVTECAERARVYCACLAASTNSSEVLHLIERLEENRSQQLRDYAWQVSRG